MRGVVGSQSYPIRSGPPADSRCTGRWAPPCIGGESWELACVRIYASHGPLWSIVLGMEVNTTIRILTVLFIPGLLMALGSSSATVTDSN